MVVRDDGTASPRVRVRSVARAFPADGELRRADVVWWGGAGPDAALLTVADDRDGAGSSCGNWSPSVRSAGCLAILG
ncbi:hypothetical protein [Streptomyces lydicus]|uniref:hypothetical protein n=1 Tax=Streptomyces lydicus TaxID=47763 RepID=UPI00378EBAE8